MQEPNAVYQDHDVNQEVEGAEKSDGDGAGEVRLSRAPLSNNAKSRAVRTLKARRARRRKRSSKL